MHYAKRGGGRRVSVTMTSLDVPLMNHEIVNYKLLFCYLHVLCIVLLHTCMHMDMHMHMHMNFIVTHNTFRYNY